MIRDKVETVWAGVQVLVVRKCITYVQNTSFMSCRSTKSFTNCGSAVEITDLKNQCALGLNQFMLSCQQLLIDFQSKKDMVKQILNFFSFLTKWTLKTIWQKNHSTQIFETI